MRCWRPPTYCPSSSNDEQNTVLVRGVVDDVNDLLYPIIQEINKIAGGCGEGRGNLEERRVHLVRKRRDQAIHHELVILVVLPLQIGRASCRERVSRCV